MEKPTYEELVEGLQDVLWQACGSYEDNEYNSMALRSYAGGIYLLERLGMAKITMRASHRYIRAEPIPAINESPQHKAGA